MGASDDGAARRPRRRKLTRGTLEGERMKLQHALGESFSGKLFSPKLGTFVIFPFHKASEQINTLNILLSVQTL